MSTQGYFGSSYDRIVRNTDTSTLHRMKETYWTTKQVVIQKLGKKEDEHVVASDAKLDAKLEVFRAIQQSTMTLLRVIKKYHDRLCAAAQEENAMGRYLKSHCSHDKTRAGKMMAAVGKSQSASAQERLALRTPLVRLYQEVETFRYRAISDTLVTVHRMEGARTEYRGALLWMKNVSEDLNPDTYKQLQKFRKVQSQVRKTKQKFDRLKLDVMQKVDLLAASRCNMFTHVLANYQSTLLSFWQKTSCNMSAVSDSFKGHQYYEFNMLKELSDTSRKLAEECNSLAAMEHKQDNSSDLEHVSDDELIDISEEQQDGQIEELADGQHKMSDAMGSPKQEDHRLLLLDGETRQGQDRQMDRSQEEQRDQSDGESGDDFGPFMAFQEDEVTMKELETDLHMAQSLMSTVKSPLDLEQPSTVAGGKDAPTEEQEQDTDVDNEDLSLLNLILNAPSTGEDEFTQEWQAVFGAPMTITPNTVPAEQDPSRRKAEFLPSSLLDTQTSSSFSHSDGGEGGGVKMVEGGSGVVSAQQPLTSASSPPPAQEKEQKKDMSAWFYLFADLDPLSNPDAVGRDSKDMTENL